MTKPIGVYVHIPFCRKRCAYCDFYTAMCVDSVKEGYIKSLKNEINRWGGALSRPADTVYFGGGTPSILGADLLSDLLKVVKSSFFVTENAEITLEVNPEDATEEFFIKVKKAGFNRLSLGFQSLDDNTLEILGRRHNAQKCVEAFNMARKAGFDNISVDLMLSLPDSSVENSILSAQKIISLSAEHISCYMLILEEKTALYAKRDKLHFPSEEAIEQEYLKISKLFCDAGYSHYEISNFAKSDKMSKHNLKYWRTQEYIGIGPSAYSFVDGERFHYENDLKGFINSPKTVNDGEGGDLLEYVMLTLRLKEGLDEEKIKLRFSKRFSEKLKKTAEKFRENGFLTLENGVISFTSKGMLVSNSLITEFMEENMYEDL